MEMERKRMKVPGYSDLANKYGEIERLIGVLKKVNAGNSINRGL